MVRFPTLTARAAVLLVLAPLALVGWPMSPAGTEAAGATWIVAPGGMPLFDLTALAPGDHGSATLLVTNPGDTPATFTVALVNLSSDDNGCNDPEQKAGDVTCGVGGGELQHDLRLSLTSPGPTATLLADATVDAWSTTTYTDPTPLAVHETRTYLVGYTLPIGSSNITQTDRVSFAFRFALDQVGAEVASEGPVIVPATPSLPATGGDARVIVMVALATVLLGLGMRRWMLARR